MSEVGAENASFSNAGKGKREIARSAAKIQNQGIAALKDGTKALGCARAPEAIQFERQKMIQQIVARRDLREHFTDLCGSVRLAHSAIGPGPLQRGRDFAHFDTLRFVLAAAIKRGVKRNTRSTACRWIVS